MAEKRSTGSCTRRVAARNSPLRTKFCISATAGPASSPAIFTWATTRTTPRTGRGDFANLTCQTYPTEMKPWWKGSVPRLFSDFDRLQTEFARSSKEHSRACDAANYAILEIPTLEPPAAARFLVHECVPGPWAGSAHVCQICNMTPGEIKRLPLLESLLAWGKAYPQQWWEYEESTKPIYDWLRLQDLGNDGGEK